MPAKRIIPALDIKDGRVVKCVQFENMRDAGDPVERAAFYDAQGADELVFLDITASHERRDIVSRPRRARHRRSLHSLHRRRRPEDHRRNASRSGGRRGQNFHQHRRF